LLTTSGGLIYKAVLPPIPSSLNTFALVQGGQNDVDNYIASCFNCNRTKHDKKSKDFLNEKNLTRRCIYVTGDVYCKTKTLNNNLKYCIVHQFV
jgi:hypothetical protein